MRAQTVGRASMSLLREVGLHDKKKYEPKYYEQNEVWKKYHNIGDIKRAKKVVNLIPDDARSVLDVGCGNGIVTNMIPKPFIVGLDFARTPLAQVKAHKIQACVDKLPVKGGKFDLVILAEVLEHLDDETDIKAIKEIKRLRSKCLLITVPFKENLELSLCKCSVCGNLFNLFHHCRKFDDFWFDKEFQQYQLQKIEYTRWCITSNEKIAKLKHKFGVFDYYDNAICNKCDNQPNVQIKYSDTYLVN